VTGRLADRIEKAVETHCSGDNARALVTDCPNE
jgi:hypothetical protein